MIVRDSGGVPPSLASEASFPMTSSALPIAATPPRAASPAGRPLPHISFWALQAAGWAMFVAALMLPWLGAYPVRLMLLTKAPLAVTGVATSLMLRWIYRALLQRRVSGWTLAATAIAASAAGALVWNVAGARMVALVAPGIEERGTVIRASLDRVDSTVYYVLVLLAWSMLYLGITHYRALQAERERSLRAEALAHEARLRALRYQVNPHLLFNTLNAISTLVVERRTADASRMIARLSDFLRVTLDGPEQEEVALAE